MDSTHSHQHAQDAQPPARASLRASWDDAWRIAFKISELKDGGRGKQALLGATLSIALAFLIALMSVHPLDAPLTIASRAIGFALPLLGMGFMFTLIKPGPGVPAFVVNLLRFTAVVVSEMLGGAAVGLALIGLLWHIDSGAAMMAGVGVIVVIIAPTLVTLAIIIRLSLVNRAAKSRGETLTLEALRDRSPFVAKFLYSTGEAVDTVGAPPQQTEA